MLNYHINKDRSIKTEVLLQFQFYLFFTLLKKENGFSYIKCFHVSIQVAGEEGEIRSNTCAL